MADGDLGLEMRDDVTCDETHIATMSLYYPYQGFDLTGRYHASPSTASILTG
jgi:hypothetical protein